MIELGQLVITGIAGSTLTAEERIFLEKENIGGVILFSHNYENPAQLAELVNSIQSCRQDYPLFIGVDHEGGRVQRFKSPFTHFPAMGDIAVTDSPKLCFEISRIMSEELRACGINVNFSPVCDILEQGHHVAIGDRSFGDSEEMVSKFITAMIRGFQTHNMVSCAKHFPGLGAATKDTHNDIVISHKTLPELKAKELMPFVKAIKARVEMIMMSHLTVDSIDPEYPCSLSSNAYKMLRSDMKYNKLIITDDMQMGAITKRYGISDSSFLAIKSGADIICYRELTFAQEALESLKKNYKTKKIKNDEVIEKIKRINNVKKTYLGEYSPIYIPDISKVFRKGNVESFLKDLNLKIESKRAKK
jgi:beta-N-acetylhexosaminidase